MSKLILNGEMIAGDGGDETADDVTIKPHVLQYVLNLDFDLSEVYAKTPGDEVDLAILICEYHNGGDQLGLILGKWIGEWMVSDDLGWHGPLKHTTVHCWIPVPRMI